MFSTTVFPRAQQKKVESLGSADYDGLEFLTASSSLPATRQSMRLVPGEDSTGNPGQASSAVTSG